MTLTWVVAIEAIVLVLGIGLASYIIAHCLKDARLWRLHRDVMSGIYDAPPGHGIPTEAALLIASYVERGENFTLVRAVRGQRIKLWRFDASYWTVGRNGQPRMVNYAFANRRSVAVRKVTPPRLDYVPVVHAS